ncbi:helix-turn-helix domain-containing protein [Blautia faecis]|uniref:helix-turn-helix domain-containing protein n=1 Tax=Blautia faecis TaxID=871665 RepID=UPI001D00C8ED|nr:helix-turn-helix domain-containing protein [Blautia faecis]MCB5484094.1 helix-turn-helix domain-containing protein [Blautia faecis]
MRRLTIKHSAIAYILNREMGYTQNAIAKLMGVSQGTVSNMIKEFEFQTKIRNLQKDLDDARAIIEKQNLLPQNEDYFC